MRRSEPASGLPVRNSWRRSRAAQVLRVVVRVTHMLLVTVTLTGWIYGDSTWLKAYCLFIPAMVIQWRVNHNACILTNLEFWITHDAHERPHPRDQQPFIGHLLSRIYGHPVSFRTTQVWAHGLAMLVWLLGLGHLRLLGAS